jgi:MFS family permease
MSGARRQIFVVFAAFMMVEKFHFDIADVALLYLVNQVLNVFLAPLIGSWVGKVGERKALMIEYTGLICVFSAYAFVSSAAIAACLYVIDHIFFSMAIAIKTYFQKIADKEDMAATASVSFTINHIAAVVIPVLFGLLWLVSPTAVFLLGATMAAISLCLSLLIPRYPEKGNEVGKGVFVPVRSTPEPL